MEVQQRYNRAYDIKRAVEVWFKDDLVQWELISLVDAKSELKDL
jgi:hypothetical protein